MEISAEMVRTLREKTGAGMMKCKEALQICKGNAEDAIDYLRKKGLASAENKAGRTTSQGLINACVSDDRRTGAIIEINCETDFVARNEHFREFSKKLGTHLLAQRAVKTPEDLNKSSFANGPVVDEARKALVTKTGENVTFGRCERLEIVSGHYGVLDAYVHGDGNPGVLVQIECASETGAKHDDLKAFAHEVSLQIAAMKPRFVNRGEVPQDVLAREKDVVLGQIKNDPKNANKPENIMAKIVDGRIDKYFKEFCLVEQIFIRDDTKTILDLINDLSKKLGGEVKIVSFRRWGIGEAGTSATPQAAAAEA